MSICCWSSRAFIIGLHTLDPVFKEFSLNEKISSITRQLHFKSPKLLQSMIIFKQPYIGGPGIRTTAAFLFFFAYNYA